MSVHGLSHDEAMKDFSKNGRDVDVDVEGATFASSGTPYPSWLVSYLNLEQHSGPALRTSHAEERPLPPIGFANQQLSHTGLLQYSLATSPENISRTQQREIMQPSVSSLLTLQIPSSNSLSPSCMSSLESHSMEPLHGGYSESFPPPYRPPLSNNTFESLQQYRLRTRSYPSHDMPRSSSVSASSTNPKQNEPLQFGFRKKVQIQPPSTTRQQKRSIHKASGDKLCRFCQQNGEAVSVYKSHNLKNELGEVVCPILYKYVCPNCKTTGKKAHTMKYCPRQTSKEVFSITAVQNMRMANGKMRAQYF